MKLSAEQAQLAQEYSQEKGLGTVTATYNAAISTDVIERALNRIACTPDPRPDRVAEAMSVVRGRLPSAHDVAERIIWRISADALR